MADIPITIEELRQPRAPRDLLDWCCQKIDEIAATKEGTTAIRMGNGLCKPLTEELYPLAMWAVNSPGVSEAAVITPSVDSLPYDAVVIDEGRDPREYFVEVTQAHMGQTEHFRMLHLETEGWSPGPLSEMQRVIDSDGQRTIQPGRVTDSMAGQVGKTIELIAEAITRKVEKRYEPPTVLIVAFEDFVVRNHEGVATQLASACRDLLAARPSPFLYLDLVGMSGRLLIHVTNAA
jgi:hypothetical protein